tara:strand:+ start:627 stop:752 length:126 start_codon:yes stop_codon:yes gene_type:complete
VTTWNPPLEDHLKAIRNIVGGVEGGYSKRFRVEVWVRLVQG